MSYRRRLSVLAVLFLTALGLVAVPAPAMAATCHAASCNAKDPQAEGCSSGAITLEELYDSGYYLELRYSATCYAAWVRVTSDGYWSQTGNYRLERRTPSSYFSGTFSAGESGTEWIRMYSYEYQLRGRLEVRNNSSGYHGLSHTPWR